MKGFGSAVSPDYVKRVATISAKTMVWVSLIGFILNGAWFFFDDFLKTLIQEIVILTATILSVINLRLSRTGRISTAIHLYTGYGTFFGMVVIWTAGDLFVHTGNFVLALSSMLAIYALDRRESVRWCVINFGAGATSILMRHFVNIWGLEDTWFKLMQMFAFNSLIMGALIFFSYRIASMLRVTLIDTLNQKEDIIEIARELGEKNDQLYKMAITDQLTGLNNRSRLDQVLFSEIERASRYDVKFSVILFDLDFFKNINDNYGHQVGDEVLEKISELVINNIRASDIAGRWGGEEFMIICPETDSESCVMLAEKIRKVMNDERINDNLKVTASFGVTEFTQGDDSRMLVKRVDDALYSAKKSGRNRTVSFS